MPPSRVVAVVGPGTDVADDVCMMAHDVGRLLAQRGVVVLTGGLGGVMAAAARGAREAGGLVIGLLPGDDKADANPDLTVAIPTGLGQARNALVVGAADGVIAVGGSWGTLSEISLARRSGKPVVSLRGWRLTDTDDHPVPLDTDGPATTPDEAVGRLFDAW